MRYKYRIVNTKLGFKIESTSSKELARMMNDFIYPSVGLIDVVNQQKIYDIFNQRIQKPEYLRDYIFIRMPLKEINKVI